MPSFRVSHSQSSQPFFLLFSEPNDRPGLLSCWHPQVKLNAEGPVLSSAMPSFCVSHSQSSHKLRAHQIYLCPYLISYTRCGETYLTLVTMVFQAFIVLLLVLNPSLETWEWENIHCHSSFQFVCFHGLHLPNLNPSNRSNFGKKLPVKQPLRFIHTKM
jgi:hypothetical protein